MKSFSLTGARRFGQNLLAEAAAAPARFNTEAAKLSKGERRFWSLFFMSALFMNQAVAQTGTVGTVGTAADTIKSTVFTIAQALFAVFLVIALVKVAKKFMSGEPDAMTSLFWLLGGLLVFFGFSALKNSLVGTGAAGNGTADGLIGQ